MLTGLLRQPQRESLFAAKGNPYESIKMESPLADQALGNPLHWETQPLPAVEVLPSLPLRNNRASVIPDR